MNVAEIFDIFGWLARPKRKHRTPLEWVGDRLGLPYVSPESFEATRKASLDDYTPAERRQMEREETENYNEHIRTAAFYAGATEWQDYDGRWHAL